MKIIFVILSSLVFFPSVAFSQGFFEREAEIERKSWLIFEPEEAMTEAMAEAFSQAYQDGAEVADDYRIEINVAARRLFLFENNKLLQTYPVAVGSSRYRTPIGPRYLKDITWNPWWFPPPYADWAKGAKPEPPGPGNPLGRVKMSLGGDILLHGTNKEYTVGTPASHGCMRMKNKDALDLAWFIQTRFSEYARLPEEELEAMREKYRRQGGASFPVKLTRLIPVDVVYERVSVWESTMEIHPDIYSRTGNLGEQILEKLSLIGIAPWEVDQTKLREIEKSPTDEPVPIIDLIALSDI